MLAFGLAAAMAAADEGVLNRLVSVSEAMVDIPRFDVEVRVAATEGKAGDSPLLRARIVKSGDSVRYDLGHMSFLVCDDKTIAVQIPQRLILMAQGGENPFAKATDALAIGERLRIWLLSAETVEEIEQDAHGPGLRLTWSEGPVAETLLHYRAEDSLISRLAYRLRASAEQQDRLLVASYDWRPVGKGAMDRLSEGRFVRNDGGEWVAGSEFQGFSVQEVGSND